MGRVGTAGFSGGLGARVGSGSAVGAAVVGAAEAAGGGAGAAAGCGPQAGTLPIRSAPASVIPAADDLKALALDLEERGDGKAADECQVGLHVRFLLV
jgi:hypothetical protein